MYILKTSYTWLPTGDRYEQRVEFKEEKDANRGLKAAFEVADSIMEDECVEDYAIELIYTNTIYKTSVRREDLLNQRRFNALDCVSRQPVNYGSTKSDSPSQLKLNNDLISRQQAIDALDGFRCGTKAAWKVIEDLPPAQPEITEDDVKEYCRKRCLIVVTSDFYGEMYRRWTSAQPERKSAYLIDPNPYGKCSNCGHLIDIRDEYNYCPNCGADMRGESDE